MSTLLNAIGLGNNPQSTNPLQSGDVAQLFPAYRQMTQDILNQKDTQAQIDLRQQGLRSGEVDYQQKVQQMQFQKNFAAASQELSQGVDTSDPKSVATYENKLAQRAMEMGHPNEAFDHIAKAHELEQIPLTAETAALNQEIKRAQVQEVRNQRALDALYSAYDQASFDAAIKGTELEGKNIPFSAEAVKSAHNRLEGEAGRAAERKAELTERKEKALEEDRAKKTNAQVKHWEALAEKERAAAANTRAGKEKIANAPGKQEVDDAERLIDTHYPELKKNKVAFEEAGRVIAADARRRMQANPALGWDEAAYQSLTAHRHSFGEDTFQGGGDTIESAIPMPKRDKELINGKFYFFPDGQRFIYNEGDVVLVHDDGSVFTKAEVEEWKKSKRGEEETPSGGFDQRAIDESLEAGAGAGG